MYVCPIDATKLQAVRHATEGLRAGDCKSELLFKPKRWRFHVERPTWGKSDIRWVSSAVRLPTAIDLAASLRRLPPSLQPCRLCNPRGDSHGDLRTSPCHPHPVTLTLTPSPSLARSSRSAQDEHTFRTCFAPLFERLRIAELFRFLGGASGLILFSGFLVMRQHTAKSHFHTDFEDTGAKAFTLMTPLYDMSDLDDCHLLCVVDEGEAEAEGRHERGDEDATLPRRGDDASLAGAPASASAADADEGDAVGDAARERIPCHRIDPSIAKQYRYP